MSEVRKHCKMTIGEMERMIKAVKKLGSTDNDEIMFRHFDQTMYAIEDDTDFIRIHFSNQSKKEKYGTWISSNIDDPHTKELIIITNEVSGPTNGESGIKY